MVQIVSAAAKNEYIISPFVGLLDQVKVYSDEDTNPLNKINSDQVEIAGRDYKKTELDQYKDQIFPLNLSMVVLISFPLKCKLLHSNPRFKYE